MECLSYLQQLFFCLLWTENAVVNDLCLKAVVDFSLRSQSDFKSTKVVDWQQNLFFILYGQLVSKAAILSVESANSPIEVEPAVVVTSFSGHP